MLTSGRQPRQGFVRSQPALVGAVGGDDHERHVAVRCRYSPSNFFCADTNIFDLTAQGLEELRLCPHLFQQAPDLWRQLPDWREDAFVGALKAAAADDLHQDPRGAKRANADQRRHRTRQTSTRGSRAIAAETSAACNQCTLLCRWLRPVFRSRRLEQYHARDVLRATCRKQAHDKTTKRVTDKQIWRRNGSAPEQLVQFVGEPRSRSRKRAGFAPSKTSAVVAAGAGHTLDARLHQAPAQGRRPERGIEDN